MKQVVDLDGCFLSRDRENLAFVWMEVHLPLVFPLCQPVQISLQIGTVGVGGNDKVGDGVIRELLHQDHMQYDWCSTRTEPWGTPESTLIVPEVSPSMNYELVSSIQECLYPAVGVSFNAVAVQLVEKKTLVDFVKRLKKSRTKTSECCPLSRFEVMSSVNYSSCVSQERPFRKPCCNE